MDFKVTIGTDQSTLLKLFLNLSPRHTGADLKVLLSRTYVVELQADGIVVSANYTPAPQVFNRLKL